MRVAHVHSSSRFDRSVTTLIEDVSGWLDEGANLVTLTEVASPERSQALQGLGWLVLHPTRPNSGRRADCAALADPDVWISRRRPSCRYLTDQTFLLGTGQQADRTHCTDGVLEHRATGKRVLVSLVHFPSAVQSGKGWSNRLRRVRAHHDAMRGWSAHVRRQIQVHKPTGVVLVFDLNADVRWPWVRAWLRFHWSQLGLRPTWRLRSLPVRGTHGRRLIDLTLTNLDLVKRPRLLGKVRSSDHRPYKEVLSHVG